MGRIAARSLRDTDSARAWGHCAWIQSNSSVPRSRHGEAPGPGTSSSSPGSFRSLTPWSLCTMPVECGLRPESTVACPGAVSDIAWSW